MKSTDAPSKQAVPFGSNGPREAITATTPSGSNQASYDQGFPPITMTLKSAGGLPPRGQDMNQILFEQSSFNRFFSAGGGYVYDSAFSTAVGGYPLSARVPNSTGTGYWFNTIEDNQTNPENTTSALTGWIPESSYGLTTISGLSSSSVTLTTLQASKERIVLSGNLTENINIVFPAWIKKWTIVNNCTGSFSVTVKTPSGSGTVIPNGEVGRVFCGGANISQDFGNAANRVVGVSAGQIPDMSSFTSIKSSAGYQMMPGGIIFQWGLLTGTTGQLAGTYPMAFTNGVFQAYAVLADKTDGTTAGITLYSENAGSVSKTTLVVQPRGTDGSGTTTARFIAIGW